MAQGYHTDTSVPSLSPNTETYLATLSLNPAVGVSYIELDPLVSSTCGWGVTAGSYLNQSYMIFVKNISGVSAVTMTSDSTIGASNANLSVGANKRATFRLLWDGVKWYLGAQPTAVA